MTQRSLETHPGHTPHGSSAPLTPLSLAQLLDRIAHEFESRNKIFDLPTARIWEPDDEIDLGFEFLGRRCASPVGPAAGPHSQLAQNIVLSWLGGSRLFELKTVQILDELEIQRPCIDMQTIGYNIEWSQELKIPESLTEYVKASMLIEILSNWEPLKAHIGDPGPHVFDMSVGYDLAGISSPEVSAFIRGMTDASAEVESLRAQIPDSFAEFRDFDFTTALSTTLTLSTFHGCPPDEIESITKHLITEHGLDVIVKLNPTLLGYETVAQIVNDELGYTNVTVKEEAFAEDLQFDRGIELIRELRDYAHKRNRVFGIKLTNTLVVENGKQWMPEDTMYLSGPPLHVLACTLLDKLAAALPGELDIPGHNNAQAVGGTRSIMVSFSAGITKENLGDALAIGVNPATVCSDLLKPGGYGRLAPMLKALTRQIAEIGATDLSSFRAARHDQAVAGGHPSVVAEYVSTLRSSGENPYRFSANEKLPREVENDLEMFGCVSCNFCITVCPNDAFFSIPSLVDTGLESMDNSRQQYLLFSELCNECGNCMTFCPENGDPAVVKPRLYTDSQVFASRETPGVLVSSEGIIGKGIAQGDLDLIERLLRSEKGNPLGPLQSASNTQENT